MSAARVTVRASMALLLLAAAACTDEAPPFVPPSFERADQVALACVDVVAVEGVPIGQCDVAEPSPDLHLLGLVTQSQRGELAVVDLTAEEILDVDPSVPGYSFHRVGELPTAVAVSPDGTRAFVASAGSRSIEVFDVGTIGQPAGRLDSIDLGEHVPFDLVADDGRLFVTAPDEGLLLIVDAQSGDLTELPLEAGGPTGGGDADAGPGGDGGVADGGAADAGAQSDAGAGSDGGGEGEGESAASRPWRMALDTEARRLYVANAGRDAISVVDADALTELEPLPSGAPTDSVAVSPVREHGDGTRFLYAVESDAGGVRVIDLEAGTLIDANRGTYERGGETFEYSDPGDAGPAIHVPGIARAVEFFGRSSAADPAPEVLDGVFAAILSSDGFLYVVDVEDDDAAARAASADEPFAIDLPHHLRSLRRFTDAELPRLAGNPLVQGVSSQVICTSDYGFLAHFRAPSGLPPCDDAGAGIEVHRDYPWIATDETWTVTYEGTIPGTVRPRADLEGDREVLDRVADFCALGVQPGDRFVLETAASPDTDGTECGPSGAEERSWTVAEVFRDRLVLDEAFGFDPAACGLDGWVSYRVRTSGEWTVVGTETGFAHAIVVGADDRCVPDPYGDVRLTGRAPQCAGADDEDCAFESATLTFSMDPGTGPTEVDTSWTFATTGALTPLAIQIGSLPTSVRYLSGIDRLFAVDPIEAGLVEVSLTSLAAERSFR